MRNFIFIGFIGILLSAQLGCSVGRVLYVTEDSKDVKKPINTSSASSDKKPDLTIDSLQDYMNLDIVWEADAHIDQNSVSRIKYHKKYYKSRYIVVEGRVGLRKSRYPVVLDTGASQPVFLNVSHVLDNKLLIYPLEEIEPELNGHKLGLCYLPLFQIGDITFTNRPCLYLEPSSTVNLFGVQISGKNTDDNTVIVGLPVLRRFKYVMFDSIKNEVEFSYNQDFEAGKTGEWGKYPIYIEEDLHGNTFLFVKIPVVGQEVELQFDTGSGRGLAIGEKLWKQLGDKFQNLNLKKGRDFYPYIGRLACQRGVLAKLEVGNRIISNAEISIFPDDSPLLAECEGLLGMQYFNDTIVVLDFVKSLMWVEKKLLEKADM